MRYHDYPLGTWQEWEYDGRWSHLSDYVLTLDLIHYLAPDYYPESVRAKLYEWACFEAKSRFMRYHEITDDDFATEHWQTLFKIKYPEAF